MAIRLESRISNLTLVDYVHDQKGKFRAIVKCKAGFPVSICRSRKEWPTAKHVFDWFKSNAILAIEFTPIGYDHTYTVYARKGNNILIMDYEIAREITVGQINGSMANTNLCDQRQYDQVGARTWADRAFVPNLPNF